MHLSNFYQFTYFFFQPYIVHLYVTYSSNQFHTSNKLDNNNSLSMTESHKTVFCLKAHHSKLVLFINGYYYSRPGQIAHPMQIGHDRVSKTFEAHPKWRTRIFCHVQKNIR